MIGGCIFTPDSYFFLLAYPKKFRRQHPFKIFVGNFYCYKLRLLIEIDGAYHLTPEIFYDGDGSEFQTRIALKK